MKQFILMLAVIFSVSAVAASQTKTTSKDINQPTAKPANDQATQLDDLVRGEISALKAYDQLLTDTKDEKQKQKLMMIRKDHEKALSKLSKYVAGKPDLLEDTQDAGAWGAFAKTWVKGGQLLGNKNALNALKQGEEHGIKEYKEALEDDSINADLKKMIKTEMLPSQEKHIEALKSFM